MAYETFIEIVTIALSLASRRFVARLATLCARARSIQSTACTFVYVRNDTDISIFRDNYRKDESTPRLEDISADARGSIASVN